MKLYTEEQIREALNDNFNFGNRAIDFALSKLTPIELPSDEEIEARARGFTDYPYGQAGFIRGCQWMKEQIKQQDNDTNTK